MKTADDLLRQFDSITNVVVETIAKSRRKLLGFIPLNTEKLTDFLQTTDIFLQNLNVPQKIIKGVHKLISFSKDVDVNKKVWKSLTVKIKKIEEIRTRITGFDLTIRLLISPPFFLAILTIRANKYDILNK